MTFASLIVAFEHMHNCTLRANETIATTLLIVWLLRLTIFLALFFPFRSAERFLNFNSRNSSLFLHFSATFHTASNVLILTRLSIRFGLFQVTHEDDKLFLQEEEKGFLCQ